MPASAWIPKPPGPHECYYCAHELPHPPKIHVKGRPGVMKHDQACEADQSGRQLYHCAERAYKADPYPGAEAEPPAPSGFEWA